MAVTVITNIGILDSLITIKEVKIVSILGIVVVGVMHHVMQHVLVSSVAVMVSRCILELRMPVEYI